MIGRSQEQQLLADIRDSGKAELVCVYGRRRVGKTYLVNEFFKNKFAFKYTAISPNGVTASSFNKLQLERFDIAVGGDYSAPSKDWFEALDRLKQKLQRVKGRKVVFIDELPWMDAPRSNFLSAFENFWNDWGCTQHELLLIVCGSATSWITNKLLGNRGGLHNRVTRHILLQPFTLKECEEYYKAAGVKMGRYDQLMCYMVMGGIPYYLSLLDKRLSLSQNIDRLFFSPNGELRGEYSFLFSSLFKKPEPYMKVVETLCGKPQRGMTVAEIEATLGKKSGGSTTRILSDLESCGFIRSYLPYGNMERGRYFKASDFYTIFYHKFIKGQTGTDEHFWTVNINTPQQHRWAGEAFERVCLAHVPQIKKALGISGIGTTAASLVCATDEGKAEAQIDLLLVRADRVVDVCEMKYSTSHYAIDKKYDMALRNKLAAVSKHFPQLYAMHLVMVTSCGLVHNAYSGVAQNEVTADDLFG